MFTNTRHRLKYGHWPVWTMWAPEWEDGWNVSSRDVRKCITCGCRQIRWASIDV
jgi:hypothetical protein